MKFTLVAAFMAFATAVSAQATPDILTPAGIQDLDHDVVCETSDASPYLHHVDQLISNVRAEDNRDKCFNQNVGRKDRLKCGPTVKNYTGKDGGAVFQMCKTKKVDGPSACGRDSPGPVSCKKCDGYKAEHVAFFLEVIKRKCKSSDRAGGKVVFKEGGDLRLYSMPGY